MKLKNPRLSISLILASLLLPGSALLGDHHGENKSDATGIWKWTMQGRDNQSRDVIMTLIQDGSNLHGTVSGRDSDRKIEKGKVTDGKLSFVSTRETQRGKMEIQYSGKVKGNTLDGMFKVEFGDRTFEREFLAKRQPANAAGKWDFVLIRDSGEEMNATLNIKENEGKHSGTFTNDNFELDLEKVSLTGATLSFQTTFEGGGESMTIKHHAAVLGDKIKGRASGERNGEAFTREWTATRRK